MNVQYVTELTVKKLSGSLSSTQSKELQTLIEGNAEFKKVHDEILRTWEESGRYMLSAQADTEASWEQLLQKKEQSRAKVFSLAPLYRVAAAIVVAVGLGLVLLNPFRMEVYETAAGETLEVTLADATVISLNESSRLEISRNFNEHQRLVEFTGEAYFDVARNPEKPFIIQSDYSEIQVLGTSFNVDAKSGSESIEVDVTSGRVSLAERGNSANQVILTKGMKGVLNPESGEVTSSTSPNQNFIAWQTRLLEFDDLNMQTVVHDVEEYFGKELEVANQAILNCKFTSSFTDPTIQEILQIISITLDLEYSVKGEGYVLSGEGCAVETE